MNVENQEAIGDRSQNASCLDKMLPSTKQLSPGIETLRGPSTAAIIYADSASKMKLST